jgi:transcriptional regulator with XRE-family HTH domain
LEELRRMREEAGFTQVGLARTSGVDRGTIIKIERGQRSPTVETLAKLARAMGAEISDFFPKAEAPLWSGKSPVRRSSAFNFKEARESLERYCERWEGLLSDGELDNKALDEFFTTAEGWLPMLDIALSAEIAEKAANGDQPRTEIGHANRRYLKLLSSVADTLANRLEDGHEGLLTVTSNVIRLQEYRDRLPKRAVG